MKDLTHEQKEKILNACSDLFRCVDCEEMKNDIVSSMVSIVRGGDVVDDPLINEVMTQNSMYHFVCEIQQVCDPIN